MSSPIQSSESSSDVENISIVDDATVIPQTPVSRPPLFDQDVVNIRTAVQAFYSKYNPEKINTIDNILKQYQGFEIQLVLHLIQKYNAVEKSDLDIFIGSLEVTELQQLAEYQIQLRNDDSKDCAPDFVKDDFKDDCSKVDNVNKKPQSLESLKGVIGTAKQTLMTSNITDISNNIAGRFLNGWNSAANTVGKPGQLNSSATNLNSAEPLNNAATTSTPPIPSALSVADELLLTTRINSMQAEMLSLEAAKSHLFGNIRTLKSQVSNLQRENTALSTELTDSAQRQETIQKNLVSALEREKKNKKDYITMSEQSESTEKNKIEMQAKLDFEILLKENKHKQLLETIGLIQKLEAQLRNITSKKFDSLPSEVILEYQNEHPEELAGIFGSKVLPNSFEVSADKEESIEKSSDCTHLTDEVRRFQWLLKVMETTLKASREELALAHQENAVSDQRIVEQQATIQSMQKRLSGIYTDLETASGSADSLKKQINETNAELLRYKLMLAVAERNLEGSTAELSDSKEELSILRESLSASSTAKNDLQYLCAEHSRQSEIAAADTIRVFSDRVLLEREEFLSRFSIVGELEEEVKSSTIIKNQKELQRLREELFKCRRSETQKERENVFLQKQLLMAADVISSLPSRPDSV